MSVIKIKGVKFFQDHLNALKAEHDFSPLPASAIATYILFHLNCDDLGILRARDPENALRKWSDNTGIPYSTLHTGREILFKRNFISETFNGNDPLYEINGYAIHNNPNSQKEGVKLNYFRLPFALKKTSALKNLVSAKDSAGLIMLLDLCNSFHRDARWKPERTDFNLSRSMKFFQEKMGKSAKKIRSWIEAIKDIFSFSPIDYKERVPNQERVAVRKKNNPIQIVIKNFSVQMANGLLSKEEDPFHVKQVEATVRKEAVVQFKRNEMVVSKKQIRDIMTAFRQETLKPLSKYVNQSDSYKVQRNRLFYHIFLGALENTINYHKESIAQDKNFRIHNIGGFFREKVKHFTLQAMIFDLSKSETIIEACKHLDPLGNVDLRELRDLWSKAEEMKYRRFHRRS
ncbi:hypothetical protein [Peribacillus asahii]|uniref:hypothetical protein n=1 Tax=Peribacillus asahii TaxID=228899 RepID=UPI00207A08F5|nr:hypothetical protein [Peribacillus asahii]USK62261.1 hypothetical protein LIT37_24105 [Peribacillus asahii]